MAQNLTQSIPRDTFLTMSVNLLHKALLEPSRTQAKQLYRELAEGRPVPLTNVRMEDGSQVRFDLGLDASEYRGKLGFGSFRDSLTVLLGRLVEALKAEREITVFTAQNDANMMIFGVTGVTHEEGQPSVLVLGADAGRDQPSVLLKLMYLDHSQFGETPGDAVEPGATKERASKG